MKVISATICMVIFIFLPAQLMADDSYMVPAKNPKIASVFRAYLLESGEKTARNIWVFFTDKNIFDKAAFEKESAVIESWYSSEAISRRQTRCDNGYQPDILDIPVNGRYLDSLSSLGMQVEMSSRWLNAASGYANAAAIERLMELDFVAEIRPVAKYYRDGNLENSGLFDKDAPDPGDLEISDYGPSLKQIDMLNARLMHRIGYDGIGIKIAVMDGGFKYDLPVFAETKIIDEYDFVHDDESVSSDIWQETQHGTSVLSVMGGFLDNELIGLAYNSEYMLYETEDYIQPDYVGEESFWVAAAERADANGADIITTSVGYLDWYDYGDLDGLTAPITVAADIAFSRGIFVVASAGNERNDAWYYVTPPADGFNVMAVGAVDSFGVITGFSSAGPTHDGRIKPEVVALGNDVHCALYNGSFGPRDGTSFAAPLVAGGVALILDSYENKPVTQIREDLMASGSRAENPDNLYGHGLPDIFRASGLVKIAPIPDIAAPVGQYTFIHLDISWFKTPPYGRVPIMENMPDSALLREYENYSWEIVYFGFPEDVGTYDARVIIVDTIDGEPKADTAAFIFRVVQRADIAFGPNPFSDSLSIFISPASGQIEDISIFTVSGDKVWDSFSDNYNELTRTVVWDGTNDRGQKVAPGVYLVVVRAQWASEKFKVFRK